MTWWHIFLLSFIAPIPAWLVWHWRIRRAKARAYLESREYRRAKFGGAIKLPNSAAIQIIEREEP